MADVDDEVVVANQETPVDETAPVDTTVDTDEETPKPTVVAQQQPQTAGQAPSDNLTTDIPGAYLDDIYAEANTIADPAKRDIFLRAALKSAQQTIRMNIAANRQQRLMEKTIIDRTLNTINQDTGVGPRTMEEARAIDPDIDNQIAQAKALDPGIQRHVDAALNHNLSMDDRSSPERKANMTRLFGLANGTPDQRAMFGGMSLALENLTYSDRKELQKVQQKILKGEYDPIKVQAALKELNPLLTELKIKPIGSDSSDPKKQGIYNMFTGALAFKLEQLVANKQPIPHDYDGLKKLAQPLIASIQESGFFFNTERKGFTPPADWRKAFIEEYGKANPNQKPDERTIGYHYQRYLEAERRKALAR